METSFTLRKFKPDDLNRVMHVNQTCLPENYSSFFFTDIYSRFPETFIVAEKENTVIGYIMCRIESSIISLSLKPLSMTKKGHVISIAVLSGNRNKGVGQALIQEALKAMSTHYNAKECYLEVRASNTPAINLYNKACFKIEKKLRGYYADGEDAYIMNKKLA